MNDKIISTDAYKGVRDFYPEDMAIQRYIFDTWSATAESFGFERYDASVLEPAGLYKAKGAENEEMVNEQTYTFIDRGDREVTLRPEMTPTVARMVAGKRRELSFPVRWYSIPNLFRYERPQRGRLREHWQLNCDIFGSSDFTSDVEMITLARQTLINFGASADMFEIRINNRKVYSDVLLSIARKFDRELTEVQITEIIRLSDKITKISPDEFISKLKNIVGEKIQVAISQFVHSPELKSIQMESEARENLFMIVDGLTSLGIKVKLDPTLARGFDYYTGTIFEIFDVSGENNRSMLGGGRYDNLTEMFGGEAISGIGFGMGDVTMRDFLETHGLLTANITAPTVMVIPTGPALNLAAQKIAQDIRRSEVNVATDISTKKLGKKIGDASERLVEYIIVVGEDELASGIFTLRSLLQESETKGSIIDLINQISN